MKCVYCPADVSNSKNIYHVAPQAAGNDLKYRGLLGEITLPHGLRCNDCNQYFGEKLEPGIVNYPYVLQWRAVSGVRSRKGRPAFMSKGVEIGIAQSGLVYLRGAQIELTRDGSLRVPQPSIDTVNHLQVSRAVHKIAFEYELLEIYRRSGLEAARRAAQTPPLSAIAEYIRRGQRHGYRPYGVQPQGAHRVGISPVRFEADPDGILITPPAFTGYIVALPGARFSCTLAADSSLLRYMLDRIERTDARAFITTRTVFWSFEFPGLLT